MSLPDPEPGMVIRYAYLWQSEHAAGREEGVKDRPCAIVVSVISQANLGRKQITVVPITHTPPSDQALAIEIPDVVKRRLGLDWQRSWIVVSEGNVFDWPGPDLRPQSGGDLSSVSYGILPPGMHKVVRQRFFDLAKHGRVSRVPRTE